MKIQGSDPPGSTMKIDVKLPPAWEVRLRHAKKPVMSVSAASPSPVRITSTVFVGNYATLHLFSVTYTCNIAGPLLQIKPRTSLFSTERRYGTLRPDLKSQVSSQHDRLATAADIDPA